MIDAHNHLHQLADPAAVVAEMKAAGVSACIVNGTSEADWPQVADLADAHPGFVVPAFGLHPWYVKHRTSDWLEVLRSLLEHHPQASIGECGVDGWIDDVPLDDQMEVFLPQLALARERDLPITIHALKAWEALHEALKTEPPPQRGFLLHSFGGSPQQAEQFAKKGARFSFSGHFLHDRKAKVLESYRHVPADRLLLETDAPSMRPPQRWITHPLPGDRNHPANLPAIASGLAEALQQPCDELTELCDANARSFFGLPRDSG
ncbi:TatD family hydrolase [Haloferula sargassicola]|uniref:D-aminoacyl-tRNA deacylase n=1 Tax=Haloferula sargassicola TaxID=490096 RepID=A0ABP9UM80_9BACT